MVAKIFGQWKSGCTIKSRMQILQSRESLSSVNHQSNDSDVLPTYLQNLWLLKTKWMKFPIFTETDRLWHRLKLAKYETTNTVQNQTKVFYLHAEKMFNWAVDWNASTDAFCEANSHFILFAMLKMYFQRDIPMVIAIHWNILFTYFSHNILFTEKLPTSVGFKLWFSK